MTYGNSVDIAVKNVIEELKINDPDILDKIDVDKVLLEFKNSETDQEPNLGEPIVHYIDLVGLLMGRPILMG